MRRLAVILAALVLAVPLAACGGEKDQTTAPETVEGGTTGGSATGTTEEGTTEEGTTEEGTTAEGTTGETEGGGGGKGDATAGKAVFAKAGCGSCHTLSDAGSSGTVGPNLDDAKPSADLVMERVTNGMGVMPSFKGQLSDKEIQDVAAYVSSVAGS
jgi:mono/diheme cytochrome c family protein